jgi:hypothetical protein
MPNLKWNFPGQACWYHTANGDTPGNIYMFPVSYANVACTPQEYPQLGWPPKPVPPYMHGYDRRAYSKWDNLKYYGLDSITIMHSAVLRQYAPKGYHTDPNPPPPPPRPPPPPPADPCCPRGPYYPCICSKDNSTIEIVGPEAEDYKGGALSWEFDVDFPDASQRYKQNFDVTAV